MENQNIVDSDYCQNCGAPLLFQNRPCPSCSSSTVKNTNTVNQTIYVSEKNLVKSSEKVYFTISLIISIIFYLILLISIVGIFYVLLFVFFGLITQGLFIGYLRGNAIIINEKQFSEVYEIAQKLTIKLGLNKMPDIYVTQSGGMLNAFATKFLSKHFVVIYSDVLELAYKEGREALEFIVCHEFTHIKRNHVQKHMFIFPATVIPFLSQAYSRACEYTCDAISSYLCPQGAVKGLLVLAAGKNLYKNVDVYEFINNSNRNSGFWTWFAEIFQTHPHLYRRLEEATRASGLYNNT